ncbi:MAG: CRISPR system precrRNA processing endoribonuclease RAMP protein Cas6 [Thiotrichales bacterium]
MTWDLKFARLQAGGQHAAPTLPLGQLRLTFSAVESVPLGDYAGSLWRGAMGHQLRRLACVTRRSHCPTCPLYHGCTYSYLFETPVPPHAPKMRLYEKAPHPFVLRPGPERNRTLEPGEHLSLDVMLIGRGHDHVAPLILSLEDAAKQGVGGARRRLRLDQVTQVDPLTRGATVIYQPDRHITPRPAQRLAPPPPPNGTVRLHLLTPTRLIGDGQLVNPERLRFKYLFGTLLRRISMLTSFHTDKPLDVDFRALTDHARDLPLDRAEVTWHDWTRYSSRQQTTLEMGGLLGTLEIDGTHIAPFWPYLWLGQFTHVGKGAVMGLGRYEIETR